MFFFLTADLHLIVSGVHVTCTTWWPDNATDIVGSYRAWVATNWWALSQWELGSLEFPLDIRRCGVS